MSRIWLNSWNTPSFRLSIVFALGLITTFLAVNTAIKLPHANIAFAEGDTIQSTLGSLTIEAADLTPEPGEIGDDALLNQFYERQDKLAAILSGDSVSIKKGDQVLAATPQAISLSHLPSIFWIQIAVGIGALIISGWVWALRSQDLASRLFFLSGLATLTFTYSAAIYTTRELALPNSFFQLLTGLNNFGASLFGTVMIALFLVYPVRVNKWRALVLGQALFFSIWTTLALLRLIPVSFGGNLVTLVEMIGICIAIGVQFFVTKRNPQARASLTWLGLAVFFGAGGFILLNATPLVFGGDATIDQGYAFLFFLVIYVGLAAGLKRFRLFEVGHWAFRFFFYTIGALLIVLADAALIFLAGMQHLSAFGLALLAVGFLYLPIRDFMWRRLQRRRQVKPHELLAEALHVAFAPSSTDRTARWEAFLKRVFDPLEIAPAEQTVAEVSIEHDGLVLLVPSLASAPSLKLSYASAGRTLFSPEARDLAGQIISLIQQAESNREAYDRGVTEERRRIAQDLHDDVGARLLTGLHKADEDIRPIFQDALADIRTMVGAIAGEKTTFDRLISEMRHETTRRLSASNIELDWPVAMSNDAETILDYQHHKAIRSVTREIVSNLIRHSGATRFSVRMDGNNKVLTLLFEDNGRGIPPQNKEGHGLENIRQRLQDIGGSFRIDSVGSGSRIVLTIPI